jgi:hypothetical protein
MSKYQLSTRPGADTSSSRITVHCNFQMAAPSWQTSFPHISIITFKHVLFVSCHNQNSHGRVSRSSWKPTELTLAATVCAAPGPRESIQMFKMLAPLGGSFPRHCHYSMFSPPWFNLHPYPQLTTEGLCRLASRGRFPERYLPMLYLDLPSQKLLEWISAICVLVRPPSDSHSPWSLRTAGLVCISSP